MDEYLRRVFTAILQSGELETIQPRIGSLLVQQAKALLVMTQATDNLQKKMSTHKNEVGDTGLILGMRQANDRQRYFVMTSLIEWAQA